MWLSWLSSRISCKRLTVDVIGLSPKLVQPHRHQQPYVSPELPGFEKHVLLNCLTDVASRFLRSILLLVDSPLYERGCRLSAFVNITAMFQSRGERISGVCRHVVLVRIVSKYRKIMSRGL